MAASGDNLMSPREFPVVCNLGDAEILIMGGQSGQGMHRDAYLFNVKQGSMRVEVQPAASGISFVSGNNQCV